MTDQDDDERIGAYAPPTDEYSTFDAREEDARRGPLLLTAALAVFILFLGVVWSAYNQGLRESGRDGAPRLVANEEPYRERPADPGGEETPGTELGVYDRLTGDAETGDEDVSLRPAPEEPIEESRPALRVETVDADEAAAPATRNSQPDVTPHPAPSRPERQPDPEPEPQPEPPASEPVRDPEPAPQPVTPPASSAVDLGGDWVVQIASFRSEADAEAAWVAFRTRFSDIASGAAPDVLSVEIPDRGTYHRLRIAAFASRDSAVEFCSTLQSRGQDCLVARR
ncbi:SPOR domain-containing protein [Maricaulis parjimensis]|uniref:SPOR domain-containing protein n=1 Tax=Maricaulis parjimensis TaxID=144023 RepID=UPI00193A219D|nr:SPOR domain-containing protein [Maricaulis parjimensis]